VIIHHLFQCLRKGNGKGDAFREEMKMMMFFTWYFFNPARIRIPSRLGHVQAKIPKGMLSFKKEEEAQLGMSPDNYDTKQIDKVLKETNADN